MIQILVSFLFVLPWQLLVQPTQRAAVAKIYTAAVIDSAISAAV